jgi:hypothetical protein
MIMMVGVDCLSPEVQPRYLIAIGRCREFCREFCRFWPLRAASATYLSSEISGLQRNSEIPCAPEQEIF